MTIDTTKDLELIGTESTVTQTLYIKAVLDDYNTIKSYTLINIVINQATCDCSALGWTNPSSGVDVTASVIKAATGAVDKVLVKPTQSDAAKATNPAF